MLLAGLLAALTATAAFAEEPVPVDGFVCPVLGGHAGEGQGKSSPDPIVMIPSGSASVLGPDVTVPTLATNDDGAGTPEVHVSPWRFRLHGHLGRTGGTWETRRLGL